MQRLQKVMNKLTDEDTVWEVVQNGPATLFKKDKPVESTALTSEQEIEASLTDNSGYATPITYAVKKKEPFIDSHLGIIEMNEEEYEGKEYKSV